jgi:hypothetical protein
VRLAVFFAADPAEDPRWVEPLFTADFDDSARLPLPLFPAADLDADFPKLADLPAAGLDAALDFVELELLPDVALLPLLPADEELDADFEDLELVGPDAPVPFLEDTDPIDVVLDPVNLNSEDFFGDDLADDPEDDFDLVLVDPALFFPDEDPFAVLPTVPTTAFAVPTAAPTAAPCRISPTTSLALSYIASRVLLPCPRADEDFFPAPFEVLIVPLERLFGIARLLYVVYEKELEIVSYSH